MMRGETTKNIKKDIVMAGNKMFEEVLRIHSPHTYNSLTKLIMAMASVAKNTGKKTLFGKDKGQESYSKFLTTLKVTLQSMVLDSVIKESTPDDQVLTELGKKMTKFSMAHPNWKDAYVYAHHFFVVNEEDAISVIGRLRTTP